MNSLHIHWRDTIRMNMRGRYSGNHYLPEVEHNYKQRSQIENKNKK